jgi:hypothetical protein
VETNSGAVGTVVIEAGTTGPLAVVNPWPGEVVRVAVHSGHRDKTTQTSGKVLTLQAEAGTDYVLTPEHAQATAAFAAVSGTRATQAKRLGKVSLGLAAGN